MCSVSFVTSAGEAYIDSDGSVGGHFLYLLASTTFFTTPCLLLDLFKLTVKQRFRFSPRRFGFCERKVYGTFDNVGRSPLDWEGTQYVAYFPIPQGLLRILCGLDSPLLILRDTHSLLPVWLFLCIAVG